MNESNVTHEVRAAQVWYDVHYANCLAETKARSESGQCMS